MKYIIILFLVEAGFSLTANLTLRNPSNVETKINLVKGQIFNSDDLGSNTQNVIIDEDLTLYFAPYEIKVVRVKVKCVESYRPSPPVGTRVHPTPFHMKRSETNNPSASIDEAVKRAKSRAQTLNALRSRERIM